MHHSSDSAFVCDLFLIEHLQIFVNEIKLHKYHMHALDTANSKLGRHRSRPRRIYT